MTLNEFKRWEETTQLLGDYEVTCGEQWSDLLLSDPVQFTLVLARYKFAAKLATMGKTVLEVGCGEGVGATILAEQAVNYTGVDPDSRSIHSAQKNNSDDRFTFICSPYLGKKFGSFQAVVSLEVPSQEIHFETLYNNLSDDGVVVVSTASDQFLNVFFHNVFSFSNSVFLACNKK